MSKILCTFSGPYGDILWSLPTVKAISQMHGEPVDMAIMPEYISLLDLFDYQPYINKSFVIDDWKCEGSPHGNQPWQPPISAIKDYAHCYHLTYRAHPGIGGRRLPLIDFIADQHGIKFVQNPLPFIEVPTSAFIGLDNYPYVAMAFNDLFSELKLSFVEVLRKAGVPLVDVNSRPWVRTAALIQHASAFVGCRSSNNVIAHGVGQKNIFIYEPHPSRRASGQFGDVFGCPYNYETTIDAIPEIAAQTCIEMLTKWKSKKENYATA